MESQLTALEDKVSRVADLCRSLRAENNALLTRLAAAEAAEAASARECQRLAGKMEAARVRLEAIALQLPQDAP